MIELLTVISIIGILGTVGTVSLQEVKRLGRDIRRLGDVKQAQTSLELYFASHNFYPPDGVSGEDGVILGGKEGGASALDDSHGWSKAPEGTIYIRLPSGNPLPGGIPYLYRSLDADGNDCELNCSNYEIRFATEGKIGEFPPGKHSVTPLGIVLPSGMAQLARPNSIVILREGAAVLGAQTLIAVKELEAQTRALLNNPAVEKASTVVAPVSIVLPITSAALAGAFFLPQYIFLFFSQPFLLLFRRKRKNWGVIYNSLTKLPVDLAVVRLIDVSKDKIFGSTVTDREGRFAFNAPPGRYRLEPQKQEYSFPSSVLTGKNIDGHYSDLYFGEELSLGNEEVPHPNVPLDPREEAMSLSRVRTKNIMRKIQVGVAAVGPALAFGSFLSRPSLLFGAILLLHIFLYLFFRRLAVSKKIKNYGVVYNESTHAPISRVVLRFYALPYNKLVETKISDSSGRYHFMVGPGEFYMTAEKSGFIRTQSDPIKVENDSGAVITASIPMRRE